MAAAWIVGAGATTMASSPNAHAESPRVDIALVLAADVSTSMTRKELELQREGYANALVSPSILQAIRDGAEGRIAIAYVEWSGEAATAVGVNWTLVGEIGTLRKVAEQIRSFAPPAPPSRSRAGRTSISYALRFSSSLLDQLEWPAGRRVIDISGDGVNNDGESVEIARAFAVRAGATINGLPIGDDVTDGEPIEDYYAREVIGGGGAFVEHAASVEDFQAALERKLWREIAGDAARMSRYAYAPTRIAIKPGQILTSFVREGADMPLVPEEIRDSCTPCQPRASRVPEIDP
jgi:hypothetical protein